MLYKLLQNQKKLVLIVGLITSGFFVFNLLAGNAHASAACPSKEYFSGDSYDYCTRSGHDIDPGHWDDGTSKAHFISEVESSTSENFYVDVMIGKGTNSSGGHDNPGSAGIADFESRINDSDIGIKVESSADFGCTNSMKSDDYKDYVFICQSTSEPALVLYSKSNPNNTYTVIKIDCGNPLGDTPLPVQKGWKLTGQTSASAGSVKPGGSITFTSKITNAGPAATDPFAYGPRYFYSNTNQTGITSVPSGEVNFSTTTGGTLDAPPASGSVYTGSHANETITGVNGSYKYICGTVGFTPPSSTAPSGQEGRSPAVCVAISTTPVVTTGTICPGDPAIPNTGIVTVGLSDMTPAGNGPNAPSGYTYSPGQLFYQEVSLHETQITGTSDTTGVSNPLGLSPQVAPPDTGKFTSSPSVVHLNWTNYVNGYPYDSNSGAVQYLSWYTETVYRTSTTVSGYVCLSGGSLSGATCTVKYAATNNPTTATTCTGSGKKQKCTTKTTNHYSCPSGGSLSGTTCSYKYSATPYYSWKLYTAAKTKTAAGTGNYSQGTACYPRNFQVDNVTGVTATASLNNQEDPSTGSGTGTANVTFSIQHGGTLRRPYTLSGVGYTSRMYGQGGMDCSAAGGGSFSVSGGTASTVTDSAPLQPITCNVAPIPVIGSQACAEYDVTPTGDTVDQNGNIVTDNGQTASGSGCSLWVENQPYLKVFGGDVAAGIDFTNATTGECDSNTSAKILTWNQGSGLFNGAGTQLAALALGSIDGFASSQGSTNPGPANGLSFANTTGMYGGTMGGNPGCSADYYDAANGPSISSDVNLSTLANGNYQASGDITVHGTVPVGSHITIYTTHNVRVTDTIDYAIGATKVEDLPAFTVVVKGGSISIVNTVTNISGNYIAQGAGSTINDCVLADGTAISHSSIFANCSNKLTVNGTFLADKLLFYRMGDQGSLRYSTSDTEANNNASEVFEYTPETWMAQPPSDNKLAPYDAITSLPPVL